jgi:hypothetical protein
MPLKLLHLILVLCIFRPVFSQDTRSSRTAKLSKPTYSIGLGLRGSPFLNSGGKPGMFQISAENQLNREVNIEAWLDYAASNVSTPEGSRFSGDISNLASLKIGLMPFVKLDKWDRFRNFSFGAGIGMRREQISLTTRKDYVDGFLILQRRENLRFIEPSYCFSLKYACNLDKRIKFAVLLNFDRFFQAQKDRSWSSVYTESRTLPVTGGLFTYLIESSGNSLIPQSTQLIIRVGYQLE